MTVSEKDTGGEMESLICIDAMKSRLFLGMRVHATSYADAVERVNGWVSACQSVYVCEAPVHMVMESYDSAEYRDIINRAALVTPGGMPLVWLMRWRGIHNQPRVYGPQLMLRICERSAQNGMKVGLYGGSPIALKKLALELKSRYPLLEIVYAYSPPFRPLTEEEDAVVCRDIVHSGAQILFVGLGCPKQERWMAAHCPKLAIVMFGVGAAFDFISGEKPWAPSWVQKCGFEWLYRLCTEPRRLWYRYLWHNSRFLILTARQLLTKDESGSVPIPAIEPSANRGIQ